MHERPWARCPLLSWPLWSIISFLFFAKFIQTIVFIYFYPPLAMHVSTSSCCASSVVHFKLGGIYMGNMYPERVTKTRLDQIAKKLIFEYQGDTVDPVCCV